MLVVKAQVTQAVDFSNGGTGLSTGEYYYFPADQVVTSLSDKNEITYATWNPGIAVTVGSRTTADSVELTDASFVFFNAGNISSTIDV